MLLEPTPPLHQQKVVRLMHYRLNLKKLVYYTFCQCRAGVEGTVLEEEGRGGEIIVNDSKQCIEVLRNELKPSSFEKRVQNTFIFCYHYHFFGLNEVFFYHLT